jgi:hypothetical protein
LEIDLNCFVLFDPKETTYHMSVIPAESPNLQGRGVGFDLDVLKSTFQARLLALEEGLSDPGVEACQIVFKEFMLLWSWIDGSKSCIDVPPTSKLQSIFDRFRRCPTREREPP